MTRLGASTLRKRLADTLNRVAYIERDLMTKIVKGEHRGIYDEKRVLLRNFIPCYKEV